MQPTVILAKDFSFSGACFWSPHCTASHRQWECWEVVCQTSEHRWSLWRSCSQDGRRSSKRCQLYGPIPVSLESSESSGLLVSTASTTSSAACYFLLHQLHEGSNIN
uniref:Uncharacterized protein n=1 Tax=Glycine max TaxID=3847 RepID=C6TI93_SOYBN|nr:unknown [Glycine max]